MRLSISIHVFQSWETLAEAAVILEGPAAYIGKALDAYELGALVAQTVQDAQAKLNTQAEEPQP
jgi:hypothetical protein